MTKIITLANLGDATEQEVFDQGTRHLLTQNMKSVSLDSCLYKCGELKCGAGCFIADDEYNKNFDNSSIDGGSSWKNLIKIGLIKSTKHDQLITRIQTIHDTTNPYEWSSYLQDLADEYGLNKDVCIESNYTK